MKNFLVLLLFPLFMAATPADLAAGKFGVLVSEKALVKTSGTSVYDTPETHLNLVRGPVVPGAFHTDKEAKPWVILKLGHSVEVRALEIFNRLGVGSELVATLTVWLSEDGENWQQVWDAGGKEEDSWVVTLTDPNGKGKMASWIKLGTHHDPPSYFHLSRVNVYGK